MADDTTCSMMPPAWRPKRPRPPPAGFECGESVATCTDNTDNVIDEEDEVGVVSFYCTLPPSPSVSSASSTTNSSSACTGNGNATHGKNKLTFSCRGRSVGALLPTEDSVDETMLDSADAYEAVDPFLFNEDYSPAGKTGFQVWSGTRLLIESLCWEPTNSSEAGGVKAEDAKEERLARYRRLIMSCDEDVTSAAGPDGDKCNILELGSGVGVVGATLAAVGANVLLTDLPTLVDNAVWPNLVRNANSTGNDHDENIQDTSPSWLGDDAIRIGRGWAAATPLDWTKPLSPNQLATSQVESIDLIVASDCVWLVSMLDALLDTVQGVFDQSKRSPKFLMSFQRRDASGGDGSALFTTVDRVLKSVKERGWSFDCLAWRPVQLGDGEGDKEVFIFEICP